jgi:hypothetical protein
MKHEAKRERNDRQVEITITKKRRGKKMGR